MANTFHMKAGDTSPILEQTLQDATGTAIDLTGASAAIRVSTRKGVSLIDAAAAIVTPANGIVSYTFDGTLTAGTYLYEMEVTYGDGSKETFPNAGFDVLVIEKSLA